MGKKGKRIKLADNDEGGMVYSTNSNFAFEGLGGMLNKDEEELSEQTLEVHIEKKHRAGKAAIIIKGFSGSADDLELLAKKLKTDLGVGGSAKNGEIIIQGDRREKAMELLEKWGYKTKRVGG